MLKHSALLLIALSFGLTASLPTAWADHHEEGDGAAATEPTPDEVATAYLDELKAKIGKQAGPAAEATATKLVDMWKDEALSEDTKKPIPGYLQKIAGQKDEAAGAAGVTALAELGPDHATKTITKILGKALKAKEPSKPLYKACLAALGTMADPGKSATKTLVDLLKYKDYDVINAAAHALAGYEKSPGKLRRDLLEDVIKLNEGTFTASKGSDNNAKTKWNVIQGGVMNAIRKLSKQNLRDPEEARKWFNDNKKDKKLWSD